MTCAITTSFLGCLVTIALFLRYIAFLNLSATAKALCLFLAIVIGCMPLLVSYKLENVLGTFYPIYRYTLYFIYIGSIILFTLTLFRDAIGIIGIKIFNCGQLFKEYAFQINLTTLAVAFIITALSLYDGIKTPSIKTITLTSDKIKSPYTVAVLSDIHIHRVISPQKIKNIVAATNAQTPDAILLAGDIIDDEVGKVSQISALLKDLKASDGVYFVTGNHEFYAGYQETVSELKKLGFTFLENNGVTLRTGLFLAGIPDLFSARQHQLDIDVNKAFANAATESFRLLMSHTPADFGTKNNFDLEISGHTHGGQIFPFHIFVKLANKYLFGLSDMENNARIYVSRGAGQWGPQMRFLAPSEITVIKLQPQQTRAVKMKQAPIDTVFSQGQINPYGKYFTGQTYLAMLNNKDEIFNAPIGNVTFEPGARTNWHKHSGGQILLILSGTGRYQEKGSGIQTLKKGDIIRIAPDIEHWHGAAPDSWMTHISIETNVPNNITTWLAPVTDKEYK